jgi:hypothetical protein
VAARGARTRSWCPEGPCARETTRARGPKWRPT